MVATDGTDLRDDLMRLNGTVHLVIVTPGRILDLMDKGAAKMEHCNMLILDEADKLLSQDFQSMLDRLVVHLPQKRQVMLYFDVFTHEIASFTQKYLDKPYEIDLLNISPLVCRELLMTIIFRQRHWKRCEWLLSMFKSNMRCCWLRMKLCR